MGSIPIARSIRITRIRRRGDRRGYGCKQLEHDQWRLTAVVYGSISTKEIVRNGTHGAFPMNRCTHLLLPLILVAGLAVNAGPAAARTADQPWQNAVDAAAFAKQEAEVRKQMEPGGQFDMIAAVDRSEVERNLAIMQRLFEARGSVSGMNNADQVKLANAQEKINALLTSNDGDRKICTLEQRSGTHFKTKICLTARQREEVRRQSQEAFQKDLLRGGPSQSAGN